VAAARKCYRSKTRSVFLRYYDILRAALLWTFSQAIGLEFDRETRAAWDQVLRIISEIMLEGASTP